MAEEEVKCTMPRGCPSLAATSRRACFVIVRQRIMTLKPWGGWENGTVQMRVEGIDKMVQQKVGVVDKEKSAVSPCQFSALEQVCLGSIVLGL